MRPEVVRFSGISINVLFYFNSLVEFMNETADEIHSTSDGACDADDKFLSSKHALDLNPEVAPR